jgi:hypothetical protein
LFITLLLHHIDIWSVRPPWWLRADAGAALRPSRRREVARSLDGCDAAAIAAAVAAAAVVVVVYVVAGHDDVAHATRAAGARSTTRAAAAEAAEAAPVL